MNHYSHNGCIANTKIYPDYEKTKYINYNCQKSVERRLPILYEKKENCCGCFACYSICPQNAISMDEDLEGFMYPRIDLSKCIKCYLCEGVCPIKKKDKEIEK